MRDDARTFRQFAQRRDHIVSGFFGIRRMNADYRINVRILFGQIDRAPAALDGSADRDDPRDTGFGRASQDILEDRRRNPDNQDAREFRLALSRIVER